MTSHRITTVLTRYKTTVLLFAVAGLLLGTVLSFVRPLEYRASTRLLITQGTLSADAYTASRSAERIADDLAQIVFTSTFFEQVMDAGYNIDKDQFPPEETQGAKRRKKWSRTVGASVTRGTGLLTVSVFHKDPKQARQIAEAISFVLTQRGWQYTSGKDITVRQVDASLVTKYPVRPNIPANAFVGLVLGALVGGVFVVVRADQEERRGRFMHRS
ncbi:hypothetical protein A3C17_04515 [Candidatus Uhrbacteria bacterium RIFCSPHIGHO2_02_FULL_53_13]|uniref:Polysaccharide chain length determinant N-terminal domain-containing protein n=2 Tax=Candidatus Uhriibacteriota TaxID=1752732 RepID=A0A1F7TV39_9BACT|nr:MAG: hypothetical protein A3C17_04515 [Candidatus Uhrbacteria bacterium RIFCSPHIGHO2_02_FULL_53_13]OGL88791.1 MAG: hypothetical protein A3I45_04640 [Candidatus Uhrbacteria bacterium RIFCSPLOWO2_02_FULL_53_10]